MARLFYIHIHCKYIIQNQINRSKRCRNQSIVCHRNPNNEFVILQKMTKAPSVTEIQRSHPSKIHEVIGEPSIVQYGIRLVFTFPVMLFCRAVTPSPWGCRDLRDVHRGYGRLCPSQVVDLNITSRGAIFNKADSGTVKGLVRPSIRKN